MELPEELAAAAAREDDVLAVDEALEALAGSDLPVADLVKLHFYAGLSIEEAASLPGISARTAYRNWSYARAWLYRRLKAEGDSPDG